MAKGVFAIALTERTKRGDGHASQKPKRVLTKDGGNFLSLLPDTLLMIAKNHDARFRMERTEILVFLDSEDAHSRNGAWSTIFTEITVFCKRNLFVSVKFFDAAFFLVEAF